MKRKVFLCIYLLLVIIAFLSTIIYKGQNVSFETETIIASAPTYNSLSLRSLYVTDGSFEGNEKVSWYYNNGTYYLFLPKAFNREQIKFIFSSEAETTLSIYHNNDLVANVNNNGIAPLTEEDYRFVLETNVRRKREYKVKVLQSTVSSVFVSLEGGNTSLHKILNDPNHNTGFPGNVTFINEEKELVTAKIQKMKGRGNATWQREKKPYQIKLEEKTSVFGMKESKTWLLLTNYPDGSLSRNSLWLTLAQKMNMDYAIHYEPIDLYINNEYQGSYLLTEKVEEGKNRVPLEEGDYLFEMDQHDDSNQIKLNHGYVVNIHYPDLDDFPNEGKKHIMNSAREYLNHIEDLIYNTNTPYEKLAEAIDLESFAKYYWLQELAVNRDAVRNSFYVYVKNGKLYAGPLWDMDATLNRSYIYTSNTGYYVLDDEVQAARTNANWYRSLLKREDFSKLVDSIFYEYYDLFADLPNFVIEYNKKIEKSARMNYTIWPYQRMINRQGQAWRSGDHDYNSSVKLLVQDLKTRWSWYQKQYSGASYDNFSYTIFKEEEQIDTGTYPEYQCLVLPEETTKLNIYGNKGKDKKLLKELEITESNCWEDKLLAKTKTSSNYKQYNHKTYSVFTCK